MTQGEKNNRNNAQISETIRKKKPDDYEKIMRRAYENSVADETTNVKDKPISYGKEKKKMSPAKKAMVAMLTGAAIGIAGTLGFEAIISPPAGIIKEVDDYVDDRIRFFARTISIGYPLDGDKIYPGDYLYLGTKGIQRVYFDKKDGHANVAYEDVDSTIASIIASAATVGENEVRCAVLGAYNAIRPYREGIREDYLNGAFKQLKNELKGNHDVFYDAGFLYEVNSLTDYLDHYGYADFEDFKMNERENLKRSVSESLDWAQENYDRRKR